MRFVGKVYHKKGPGLGNIVVQLDEVETNNFFRSAHGQNMDEVCRLYESKLQRYEYHEHHYSHGGQFLPLSVWER